VITGRTAATMKPSIQVTIRALRHPLVIGCFFITITHISAKRGIPMAIADVVWGCILCITIIGIPFGKQFFKLAKLSLMPFGATVA